MKTTKKFVCLFLAVLVFSAVAVSTAQAAAITFLNSLNIRVSITMAYVDAHSGSLTTKGWWHVEPGGETVVTVDADESKGIYYAAYNKNQYYDSSLSGANRIKRWASPRTFTYTTDEMPYDDGVWNGTFYRISGRSVQIDTSVAPSGRTSANTKRVEPNVLSNARPSTIFGNDEEDLEALGDRLSSEYFSDEELEAASKDTLNYLRNRIYANHGYNFLTQKWREVFSRCDWYRPNPDFSEQLFNEYERGNLRRIMVAERNK